MVNKFICLYFKCHTILKNKKNQQRFLRIDLKGKTELAELEGIDKKSSSVRQLIHQNENQSRNGEKMIKKDNKLLTQRARTKP